MQSELRRADEKLKKVTFGRGQIKCEEVKYLLGKISHAGCQTYEGSRWINRMLITNRNKMNS